ncbi:hypothetical protein VNI00_002805 [Paramarasmius palmivorus]|uniref:Methyltransferase domain-containing protein n=1 Tax=Paramarasmius palmivorus TaxID=297713 RepID=A0AAW0DZ69_9AGAR
MGNDPTLQSHYAILDRGDAERERLNQQFYFYKKWQGRNLIIDPGATIPPDGAVLDAATGTGAWILSLAKELPSSVSLYAVDLAPTLWRPSEAPPNIHYTLSSVTSLPKDWTAKFDLVNQSLLTVALKATDWPLDIAELYRVTKPGGHVQLVEVTGIPSSNKPLEGTNADIFHQLWLRIKEKGGYMTGAQSHLPRMLEEAGFQDVSVQIKPAPKLGRRFGGEDGVEALDNTTKSLRAIKDLVLLNDGFGMAKDENEYDALLEEFVKEAEMQVLYGLEMCLVCARKPV